MKRTVLFFIIIACSFTLPLAARAAPVDRVVLISVDGMDRRHLPHMENLNLMRAVGAWTLGARTPLPAVTVVSHAAMLSGMGPELNGVGGEAYPRDPAEQAAWRPLTAPTAITFLSSRRRFVSAFVMKPKMNGLLPREGVNGMYGFSVNQPSLVAAACKELSAPPEAAVDALVFVHLKAVDAAGHARGWMSPAQLRVVRETDKDVAQLRNCMVKGDQLLGLHSILIVTSDHGGHGRTHGTEEDSRVPWIATEFPGPRAVLKRGEIKGMVRLVDTAPTITSILGLGEMPNVDGRVIPILK